MILYLNLLCITIIVVLVTDVFRFWDNFSSEIISWITKGKVKKPIDIKILQCSICQNFWLSLIYLIVVGSVTLYNILYILLLSFATQIILNLLLSIENIVITLINKMNGRVE